MATILVAANAHLDRVWRLAGPLRPGGRNRYIAVATRYGGGGFNTGSVLLALGHRVRLVASLADDDAGRACRAALAARGFGIAAVGIDAGATQPLEILLDPSGERTIVSPSAARQAPARLALGDSDLAYVNLQQLPGDAKDIHGRATQIVAQYPLRPGEERPARVLIASRSDVGHDDDALRVDARRIAGDALEALVVTAAAEPVTILSQGVPRAFPIDRLPDGIDTTGAGDFFAAGLLDGLARGASIADAVAGAIEIARRVLADRSAFLDDHLAG